MTRVDLANVIPKIDQKIGATGTVLILKNACTRYPIIVAIKPYMIIFSLPSASFTAWKALLNIKKRKHK
jgi:hypothetical protein